MKHRLLLLGCLCIYTQVASACTEIGPHEFTISKSLENSCARVAEKMALAMAATMPKNDKKSDVPQGKATIESATLFKTQKDSSQNINIAGYNVTLNTENHWQCTYCVDIELDSNNHCQIIKAYRFMCAS